MSEEVEYPKLPFSIVYCTGEDEAFPVSQLVRHTGSAQRGYHSMKMCEYPQEIILRFDGEVQLRSIRILAHETKIPSRIDLAVCRPDANGGSSGHTFPPVSSAIFHRLGYLNFTNNEASGYESRELKTAVLNTRAVYIKLSLRRCHANMSNVFNQVGIVAIGCYGEMVNEYAPLADADTYAEHLPGSVRESLQLRLRGVAGSHDGSSAIETSVIEHRHQQQQATAGSSANSVPSLAIDTLDPAVVHKMDELSAKKAKAVAAEDYDTAKRLKILIDRLRDCGQTLADLEERKRRSIEAEDYDVAKALKLQIDDVKETVQHELDDADRQLQGTEIVPGASSSNVFHQKSAGSKQGNKPATALSQQQQQSKNLQQQFDDQPVGGGGGVKVAAPHSAPPFPAAHHPSPMPKREPSKPQPQQRQEDVQKERQREDDDDTHAQQQQQRRASSFDERPAVSVRNLHDEVPAVASEAAAIEKINSNTGGIVVTHHSADVQAASSEKAEEIETDWERALVAMISSETSSDIPAPDPLPAKQAPAAQQLLINQFGRYITSCLKSKRFQHREAAVRVLTSDAGVSVLEKRGGKSPVACMNAMLDYLNDKGVGVDDGIPQAFFAACDAIKTALTGGITGVTAGDVSAGITALMPQLLLKAGDSNQRVREHASATLVLIAMSSAIGPERVAAALLHDPQTESKRPLNFRVQLARLSLATVLLAKVGLHSKAKHTGLTAEGLTKQLCIPQLTHQSGEVREAAVHLIVALYGLVPEKLMEALLAEVKPAQKALIDEQLVMNNNNSASAGPGSKAGAPAATTAGAAVGAAAAGKNSAAAAEEEELKSNSIQIHQAGPMAAARAAAVAAAQAEQKEKAAAVASVPAPKPPAKAPAAAPPAAKGHRESPQTSALPAAVASAKKAPATPRGKAGDAKKTVAAIASASQSSSSSSAAAPAAPAAVAASTSAKKVPPASPAAAAAAKSAAKSPQPKPAAKKAVAAAPASASASVKGPAPAPAAVAATTPQQQQQQQPVDETGDDGDEHSCQFCGRHDPRYNEESLDRHYLRSCPMLCACPLCGQITEIALLQEHLTGECAKKSLVRPCPNCHEAIRAQDLDQHIADASCVKFQPHEYNVCPLCHEKTAPFEEGWKSHFARQPGCVNNPRPFDGGNIEEDFQD